MKTQPIQAAQLFNNIANDCLRLASFDTTSPLLVTPANRDILSAGDDALLQYTNILVRMYVRHHIESCEGSRGIVIFTLSVCVVGCRRRRRCWCRRCCVAGAMIIIGSTYQHGYGTI